MRVLLDANIFISFLLNPTRDSPSALIIRAAIQQRFTLLLPEQLLQEFVGKIKQKPYLAGRIRPEELMRLVKLLEAVAEIIPPITQSIPAVTRDPKDDYLLAHALLGAADYLVTGDHDLLVLDQMIGVRIVTPAAFLQTFIGDDL